MVISEPDPEFEVYESVFVSNEMRASFKQSATSATIAESAGVLDFFKRAIGRTLVSLQQCHASWVISWIIPRFLSLALARQLLLTSRPMICFL